MGWTEHKGERRANCSLLSWDIRGLLLLNISASGSQAFGLELGLTLPGLQFPGLRICAGTTLPALLASTQKTADSGTSSPPVSCERIPAPDSPCMRLCLSVLLGLFLWRTLTVCLCSAWVVSSNLSSDSTILSSAQFNLLPKYLINHGSFWLVVSDSGYCPWKHPGEDWLAEGRMNVPSSRKGLFASVRFLEGRHYLNQFTVLRFLGLSLQGTSTTEICKNSIHHSQGCVFSPFHLLGSPLPR